MHDMADGTDVQADLYGDLRLGPRQDVIGIEDVTGFIIGAGERGSSQSGGLLLLG